MFQHKMSFGSAGGPGGGMPPSPGGYGGPGSGPGMGPPQPHHHHTMGPPQTMGPPPSASPLANNHGGDQGPTPPQSQPPPGPEGPPGPHDNGSVTSLVTTGPDGAPLDEASQQSTLSNASAGMSDLFQHTMN